MCLVGGSWPGFFEGMHQLKFPYHNFYYDAKAHSWFDAHEQLVAEEAVTADPAASLPAELLARIDEENRRECEASRETVKQ